MTDHHRLHLDARRRVLALVGVATLVFAPPAVNSLSAAALVALLLIQPSVVRRHVCQRMLALAPWPAAAALGSFIPYFQVDPTHAFALACKTWLAMGGVFLLLGARSAGQLAAELRELGVPADLLAAASLMLRYHELAMEELQRSRRAMVARLPVVDNGVLWRLLPRLVALTLLRGWDRSERVHRAMLARGLATEPVSRK